MTDISNWSSELAQRLSRAGINYVLRFPFRSSFYLFTACCAHFKGVWNLWPLAIEYQSVSVKKDGSVSNKRVGQSSLFDRQSRGFLCQSGHSTVYPIVDATK